MTEPLNPDMPAQELRLHMGELNPNEVLVARAAIAWANSRGTNDDAIKAIEQQFEALVRQSERAQAIDECAALADKLCNPNGAYAALGEKIRDLKTTGESK